LEERFFAVLLIIVDKLAELVRRACAIGPGRAVPDL